MLVSAQRKAWPLVISVAAAAVVLAGCGSSSSSTGAAAGSTSAAPTSAAPAATTTGGGGADTGASAEVAAAKSAVAPLLTTPTDIHQTIPLTGKIPTDKPWVIITCELPQCKILSDGAQAAAAKAGLPTKLLSYKTTDGTTLTSAMKQALTYNPIAVSPVGFSQAVWQSLIPQYTAKKVLITTIAVGDTVPGGVVTQGSGSQLDYTASGKGMANYVIADSNGAAKVLVEDVPAFAVLKAFGDGFKSQIKSACSGCSVTDLDLAPAQLATNSVVPAIIAAIQKDKSIKYLVATDGAFLTGITTAFKAAGISGVKIVGGSPDINNITAAKSGDQTAWTSAAEQEYGWVALDIIGRTTLGMTVPAGDGGRVDEILTKDNIGTPNDELQAPADFEGLYSKLWGLS